MGLIQATSVRQAAAAWVGPLGVMAAYLATAMIAIDLTTRANGLAAVWPSSGVLLAALVLAPRAARVRYVAATALAGAVANLHAGHALPVAFGFTAANMAESVLAAWLMRRGDRSRPSFVRAEGLGRFCVAAVLGSAASAVLATLVADLLLPASGFGFWLSWFTTALLGALVIAPMILIVAELRQAGWRGIDRQRIAEAALLLGTVAAVAACTFAQSSYPILFLPLVALLGAVFRLGAFGAAASVWIIATVASLATGLGTGPILLVEGGRAAQVLFLQFYILTAFASALPIAALLAARDRLTAQVLERNRLLSMAEGVAQVGHWRLDVGSQAVFWSEEVFRICGRTSRTPPTLPEAIEAYHPDDRACLVAIVNGALDGGPPFEFNARVVWPDGQVRHVLSRGEADRRGDGQVVGLFGIIQDVSLQVRAQEALEHARRTAEEAARRATAMAETDALTGLPNRRKTLQVLEEALADARFARGVVSIAMFDIDHFKRVNDVLGHATGDTVLCRVARDARAVLRGGDTVGRIGGEEFVLVLPHADRDGAATVAERVRLAILAGGGESMDDPRVSASFGVATSSGEETVDALLGLADGALYRAKAAGRNTLCHAA